MTAVTRWCSPLDQEERRSLFLALRDAIIATHGRLRLELISLAKDLYR